MGATAPGRAGSDEKYWTLAVLTWDDLQRILRDNTLEVRSAARNYYYYHAHCSRALTRSFQELARSPEMQQKYGMFKRQVRTELLWFSGSCQLTRPVLSRRRVAEPRLGQHGGLFAAPILQLRVLHVPGTEQAASGPPTRRGAPRPQARVGAE